VAQGLIIIIIEGMIIEIIIIIGDLIQKEDIEIILIFIGKTSKKIMIMITKKEKPN